MPLALLGILLVLTIPFHPFWPDFELARRGLLLITTGVLLIGASRWWPKKLPPGSLAFAALIVLVLLGSIGTVNPMNGLYRGLHLLALGLVLIWGSTQRIDALLRASLPITLVLSAYGLVQALGVAWPGGYAENQAGGAIPVSTLGNLNVASEVLTMGAALAALHCARLPRPGPAMLTLGLAVCYLILNGSRSSCLALAPACILVLLGAPRRKPLLLGLALGLALGAGSVWSTRAEGDATAVTTNASASTVAVRLEIWNSCWQLFGESWLLGQGSGEFAQQYPRVRSQREIELSSFGRRFRTSVDTAHNDTIEIAVETGLLGLFTWFGFWLVALAGVLRHDERGVSRLAPLIAFLALSLTRSPLGNAPAAGIAFLFLGSALRRRRTDQDWVEHWSPNRWICMALGLGLIALGAMPLLSQTRAAAYVAKLRAGRPEASLLDRAIWWDGSDRRLRELRVQHRLRNMDPKAALAASMVDLNHLISHSPHNSFALLLVAQTLHRAGETSQAENYLGHLLELDSRDPEAVLMLATMRCDAGQAASAVAILYADPHPRLRAELPRHLGDLAELARSRGNAKGGALLVREQSFMTALLVLERDPGGSDSVAAVQAFRKLVSRVEPRGLVLAASLSLAAGDLSATDALGRQALVGQSMNRASMRLMSQLVAKLGALESWAQYFGNARKAGG